MTANLKTFIAYSLLGRPRTPRSVVAPAPSYLKTSRYEESNRDPAAARAVGLSRNGAAGSTLLVLGLLVVMAACRPVGPPVGGKVVVAASIGPLASLAESVGRSRVEVTQLVPSGASPHTYDPTASQVELLGRADVLLLVGMGLEFWADDLVSAADNPDLVVVITSERVDPIGDNPHIWLDPMNAISQAELIRDALVEVEPDGEETYRDSTAVLIDDLRRLDREVSEQVSSWSERSFVAFHPAWAYFARRYGLEEAAVVEETPGHEPSPAEVAEIVETARDVGARAIFAEAQFPPGIARAIADEAGARVALLDPLGGTAAPEDYVGLIRYNVDVMAQAMK